MIRLPGRGSGAYTEVAAARRGLLRVAVRVPDRAGGTDLTDLRALLAADLLARSAELGESQVLTAWMVPEQSAERIEALSREADALGMHPAAIRALPEEVRESLGGHVDVCVAGVGDDMADDLGGLLLQVGRARVALAGGRAGAANGAARVADPAQTAGMAGLAGAPSGLFDPLALRLAFLMVPIGQDAGVTEAALTGARQTLERWRILVAEWAESSSRPVPERVVKAARTAFEELDTVSVLALLNSAEDEGDIPDGAKFETFAYADRVLGLDLAREIGKPRG